MPKKPTSLREYLQSRPRRQTPESQDPPPPLPPDLEPPPGIPPLPPHLRILPPHLRPGTWYTTESQASTPPAPYVRLPPSLNLPADIRDPPSDHPLRGLHLFHLDLTRVLGELEESRQKITCYPQYRAYQLGQKDATARIGVALSELPPDFGPQLLPFARYFEARLREDVQLSLWSSAHREIQRKYRVHILVERKWQYIVRNAEYKTSLIKVKHREGRIPTWPEDIWITYEGPIIKHFGGFVRRAVAFFFQEYEKFCEDFSQCGTERIRLRKEATYTPDNFLFPEYPISWEQWNQPPPLRCPECPGPFDYAKPLKKQFRKFLRFWLDTHVIYDSIDGEGYVPLQESEKPNFERLLFGPESPEDIVLPETGIDEVD